MTPRLLHLAAAMAACFAALPAHAQFSQTYAQFGYSASVTVDITGKAQQSFTTPATGNYTFTDNTLVNGEVVTVTGPARVGGASTTVSSYAKDSTPPNAPTSFAYSAAAKTLSFTTNVGPLSRVYSSETRYATATSSDENGASLADIRLENYATATATPDTWNVVLTEAALLPYAYGMSYEIRVADVAGNASPSQDFIRPVEVNSASLTAAHTISGMASPGTTVTVFSPSQQALGSAVADAAGAYSIAYAPAQPAGTTLTVTANQPNTNIQPLDWQNRPNPDYQKTFASTTLVAATPPKANDDGADVVAQQPGTGNVLGNDGSGSDASAEKSILLTGPSHGSLAPQAGGALLTPEGDFTYTSSGSFTGIDTFTYQIDGGRAGLSNIATVTITVRPKAGDDSYATSANKALAPAAPGVLATDIATAPTALTVTTPPANAKAFTLNPDGSFSYTPADGFVGTDSFAYTVTADGGVSAPATVTLTVTAAGAPTGTADSYTTPVDTALTTAAPGVLANDTAPAGQTLTAAVATPPTNGTLALNADGSFTYTPKPKFEGTDSFTYLASYDSSKAARVSGGNTKAAPFVDSAPVTVTINVTAATTPPTGASAQPVPTLGHAGWVLLSGLVAGVAALRRRRTGPLR